MNWLKKLGKWVKGLFVKVDLVEMAELYLLTRKIDPREVTLIRQYITEIKFKGVEKAIKKEAKKRLRKLLVNYIAEH